MERAILMGEHMTKPHLPPTFGFPPAQFSTVPGPAEMSGMTPIAVLMSVNSTPPASAGPIASAIPVSLPPITDELIRSLTKRRGR